MGEQGTAGLSYDVAKRALDIAGSAVGLAVAAPVLGVAAAAIRVAMGAPVLFRQPRSGRNGGSFSLIKLRTMREALPGEDPVSSDGLRLTPLGRLLRASSIDELPTLWNVLCGHMSLVGPRPLLVSYLDRYSPEQARRHEVKPGITGWAQVNGRNALSWEEKLDLDVWYVEHRSMFLDLKILAKTAVKVLARRGISASGVATMPEFRGSRERRS